MRGVPLRHSRGHRFHGQVETLCIKDIFSFRQACLQEQGAPASVKTMAIHKGHS